MRHTASILAVVLFLAAGSSAEDMIGAAAPEFTLQDQFDRTVSLGQFAGRPVVLVASDKEGRVQNAAWIKAVTDRYDGRVALQGIADVSSAPFFLRGFIRGTLRKESYGILLDWTGDVSRSFGFSAAVSNVVLIDGQGSMRFRHAGPADADAVARLFEAIERAGTPPTGR